jgi:HAD superfamily phosphoserine phosphatase-like hydrolase
MKWLEHFAADFREKIAAHLGGGGSSKLACFDADGTLWSEDIGEAQFRWLAAGSLLPWLGRPRAVDELWAEYEARVAKNKSEGYAWAVQCMSGLAESEVQRWSRQLAYAWPNYRPAMVELIKGLRGAGVEVWLVSASNGWVIEAAAPFVGADEKHVLGIRVEVAGGVLTDRVVHPVTCQAGKVDAIMKRIGRKPDFAFGDSLGDLEMLEHAKVPLVIGRHDKPNAELPKIARDRGWAFHAF